MSVSVNQILSDARRLVSRLRDHDSSADTIIHKAQILYKNVQDMKESEEEGVVEVGSVVCENRHIRELRQENRELRVLLEEHQCALELLMSKYRQRATALVTCHATLLTPLATQDLQRGADAVVAAAGVMATALAVDEAGAAAERERLTQLRTENRGLRELLQISHSFHSLPPLTHDAHAQTDS